jgi:hypothetical protein
MQALRLDLIGPENGTELGAEILPQAPSRWYLTGALTRCQFIFSSNPARKLVSARKPVSVHLFGQE